MDVCEEVIDEHVTYEEDKNYYLIYEKLLPQIKLIIKVYG